MTGYSLGLAGASAKYISQVLSDPIELLILAKLNMILACNLW